MVRYDVKGKSNLTDAFGIDGGGGGGGFSEGGSGQVGRRSYWVDPPGVRTRGASWKGAPGVFRRKLPIRHDGKSNQGDSAGPRAPNYVYVWRQLSAEIRFLALCGGSSLSAVNHDRSTLMEEREESFHD